MPCLLIEVPGNAHEDSVLGSAPVQGGVHHVEALESEIQKTSVSSEATFQSKKLIWDYFSSVRFCQESLS